MSSIRATLTVSVLAGVGMLSGGASAMPIDNGAPTVLHRNVQEARLVCDVFGRCVRRGPPVVRTLPGIRYGRPIYGGPEIGVRGGFGVDRRGDFERQGDRGRMDGGDRGDHGDRGGQAQRNRRDNGGDGQARMQGDQGDRGGQGRRRPQQGDQGGQRGGGDQQ